MARLVAFEVEKRTAHNYSGDVGGPYAQDELIKATLTVIDDEGKPTAGTIKLTTDHNVGFVRWLNVNYEVIDQEDEILSVDTPHSGPLTGVLTLYMLAPFPIIVNVQAWLQGQPVVAQNLVFYTFGINTTGTLDAPNLQMEEGIVKAPAWDQLQYSNAASVKTVSTTIADDTATAVFCNGELVSVITYLHLITGFKVPYRLMQMDGQRSNLIGYLVDNRSSPKESKTTAFQARGIPLQMPDPDNGATLPSPHYVLGTPGRLTLDDLKLYKGILNVIFPLSTTATIGDKYDIYVYLNGYTPSTDPVTRRKGPFSVKLTSDDIDIGQIMVPIPQGVVIGYGKKDDANYGYMWIDCQVNQQEWTRPWHVRIDFTATLKRVRDREELIYSQFKKSLLINQ